MVDRYNIQVANPIGHGAFGKIFPCTIAPNFYDYLRSNGVQMSSDCASQLFAVKIQSYDTIFEGQLHLLREIDVLMRTKNYPGTVEIFDFYLNNDTNQAFLILKLADLSLDKYIRSTVDVLKRIEFLPFFCAQMLLHLGYLKHNSIAHRDIKPQNILIQNAPLVYGWRIDKSLIDADSRHRKISVDCVKLVESQDSPIKQLCKHFLPMAHNCTCFDSQTEPVTKNVAYRFEVYEDVEINVKDGSFRNRSAFGVPLPSQSAATNSKFRIGSCPSRNLFDSYDGMDEDEEIIDNQSQQQQQQNQRSTVLPLHLECFKRIQSQLKSIPFAYLCDFGLSKHMNKTHHSPYIVTPNFRSPELFDAQVFVNEEETPLAKKPLTLRSSFQMLMAPESTNSPSSSDPNDISLKREEDSVYNENIDVWGLGCTLAQLVTGKPLFPGKNLQTVYSAIRNLLCITKTRATPSTIISPEQHDNQFELDDLQTDSFKNEATLPEKKLETIWITSNRKRAERIRQKIFLQLVASNEQTAQRVCDQLGNEFFDMLAQMLDPNPLTRPHAEQLFTHRFVEPFVKPSLLLIFAIASDKPQRCAPVMKFSRREDHHWWAFQEGLCADAFDKNPLQLFDQQRERKIIFQYRSFIFCFMLDVVRQTNCRYQTLFSALYHFDRCIANFPRNVKQILLQQQNYNLLAVCCLYLVVRYYERIYITTLTLLQHLELNVEKGIEQKFMALFLDSISGQITLPSAWHFVLLCFGELTLLKEKEFDILSVYKAALATIFRHQGLIHLKKTKRKKNVEREQFLNSLKSISTANNEILAETLRADARNCKKIYTSQFKKHCSRLLFLIMIHLDAPYLQHNNRALGEIVFKRCLFNALFVESFDRLSLRHETTLYSRSTVALVKSRFN